ncbi:hypothetical protein CIPAW_10G030600 [Carya illinoinensis]|uniref:Uncharacterized protein n=1 Tax=Carya illinoinensis TaxID=32201 RepID=A0A8T1PAQ0_CARIL|nr:hypothetical protein CIPAW_10G030600 [Carya illinoinensis]
MENPITTTETDAEHPAPVSIDGVGDGDVLLPCADALATAIAMRRMGPRLSPWLAGQLRILVGVAMGAGENCSVAMFGAEYETDTLHDVGWHLGVMSVGTYAAVPRCGWEQIVHTYRIELHVGLWQSTSF